MEIVIVFWICCGIAAAFVASSREANGCLWFGLGVLLGPIGLAMSFAASGEQKKCPYCQSGIDAKAVRCPKCQADLDRRAPAIASGVATNAVVDTCTKCGSGVSAQFAYCGVCGTSVSPPLLHCVKCGAEIPPGHRFCGSCGAEIVVITDLNGSVTPPESVHGPAIGEVQAQTESASIPPGLTQPAPQARSHRGRNIAVAILISVLGIGLLIVWERGGPEPEGFNGDHVSDFNKVTELYNAAQGRIVVDHPDFRSKNFSGFSGAIVRQRRGIYTVLLHYQDYEANRKFLCTMWEKDAPRSDAAPPGLYLTSGGWSVYCGEK